MVLYRCMHFLTDEQTDQLECLARIRAFTHEYSFCLYRQILILIAQLLDFPIPWIWPVFAKLAHGISVKQNQWIDKNVNKSQSSKFIYIMKNWQAWKEELPGYQQQGLWFAEWEIKQFLRVRVGVLRKNSEKGSYGVSTECFKLAKINIQFF